MTAKKSGKKSGGAKSAGKSGSAKKGASKSKDSRAKTAQTDPKALGMLDSKQQSALYRGGSLAQRGSNAEGQLGDAESQSGNEVTSASPPNVRERGKASSPSFDEVPVSGKDEGKGTHPRSGGKSSQSGSSGSVPNSQDPRGTVGPHQPAGLPSDVDDMEPGTSIEKIGGTNPEVRIRTAIAGGAVRIFSGPTYRDALDQLHKFLRGDALVLPTASDQEKRAVADANEANARAVRGQSTKQEDTPGARKSSSKRSKSGAKRK